jgi:hypothetical protein
MTIPVAGFLLLAITGAAGGTQEAKPTDEALLSQVKELAPQVRKSDLIVVGQLRILDTLDGHVGTIQVSEVLFGKAGVKSVTFISEPMALQEGQERIWFLSPEGDRWRVRSGGAAVSEKDGLRWLITKLKPPKPAGGELAFPNENDSTARLIQYLDDKEGHVRAMAIDLLGARKAREAIPRLRALLSDGTALRGSDHFVAQHAAKALTEITGVRVDPFETFPEDRPMAPGERKESIQELIQEIRTLRQRLDQLERRLSELEKKPSN